MYILYIKAFADFDIPFDTGLAVIENKEVADELCVILNNFCKALNGCNQDVRLSKYLVHKDWVDKLEKELNEKTRINKSQINSFIEILISVCNSECVYVYPDIFSVKWIMSLN